MGFGTKLVPKRALQPHAQQPQQLQQEVPEKTIGVSRGPSRPASATRVRPMSGTAREGPGSKAPQSATLHAAAGKGQVSFIKDMVDGKADVNALDRFGSTGMYVYTYVCVYACLYVCVYVCMYV